MAAIYRYCRIHLDSIGQDFYYRTEDETLRTGDFVAVPFGRENRERTGLLMSVTLCTAADAPYPPEKTKEILRRAERPAHWGEPKPPKKVARQPAVPSDVPSPAPPSAPRQPESALILSAAQKSEEKAAAATGHRRLPGCKRGIARMIGIAAAALLCTIGALWMRRLYGFPVCAGRNRLGNRGICPGADADTAGAGVVSRQPYAATTGGGGADGDPER